jgi:hypothetical protein
MTGVARYDKTLKFEFAFFPRLVIREMHNQSTFCDFVAK